MSALLELIKLIPPPEDGPYNFDWDKVEKELNTRLPDDYKALVSTYGSGEFVGYIRLLAPEGLYNLMERAHGLVEAYFFEDSYLLKDLQEQTSIFCTSPLPLLAWASSSVEDIFYYVTDDSNPNKWSILHCDTMDFVTFNGTATEYLLGIFTRTVHNDFTEGYYETSITQRPLIFTPYHND